MCIRDRLKNDKLDKTGTAADSSKLGGKLPEAYVHTEDVLTLEEIEASTDLTGKVASAKAAYELSKKGKHISFSASSSSAVPASTWTKLSGSYTLEAGVYLLVVPFIRDQGGDDSTFFVELAISTASTYGGDAQLSGCSGNWKSPSLGAKLYSIATAGTYNVFVKHYASTAHTIDIRGNFIRL